jgi:ATP-dependent Clp protease ATP-binding subunit ClpA
LDAVIHFAALEQKTVEAIAEKYLHLLQCRAEAVGVHLQYCGALAAHLERRCKGKGGARMLRKLVQEELEGPLASMLLRSAKKPDSVAVHLEEGQLRFECLTK